MQSSLSSSSSQHDRMMRIAAAIEQRHRMLQMQQLQEESEYAHQHHQHHEQLQPQLGQQSALSKEGEPPSPVPPQEQQHAFLSYRPTSLQASGIIASAPPQTEAQPQPQPLLHAYSRPGQADGSGEPLAPSNFHPYAPAQRAGTVHTDPSMSAYAYHASPVTTAVSPILSAPSSGPMRPPAATTTMTASRPAGTPASSASVSARPLPSGRVSAAPVAVRAVSPAATAVAPAPVYGPTVVPQHPQFVDISTSTCSMVPFGLHDEAYLRRIGAIDASEAVAGAPTQSTAEGVKGDARRTHDLVHEGCHLCQDDATLQQAQTPLGTLTVSQQQSRAPLPGSSAASAKSVVPTPRSQQQSQQQHQQQQQHAAVQIDATPAHQTSRSAMYQQHQYVWSSCSAASQDCSPAASSALGLTVSAAKQRPARLDTTWDESGMKMPDTAEDSAFVATTRDGVSHKLEDSLHAEAEVAARRQQQPQAVTIVRKLVPAAAAPTTSTIAAGPVATPVARATPPQTELGKAMQQLIHQIQQKKMGVRAEVSLPHGKAPAPSATDEAVTATPPPSAELTRANTSAAARDATAGERSVTETPMGKQPGSCAGGKTHELRDTPPSSRRRPPSPQSRSLHVIKIVTPKGGAAPPGAAAVGNHSHSGPTRNASAPLDAQGSRHGEPTGAHDASTTTASNNSTEVAEGYRPVNTRRSLLPDCLEATPREPQEGASHASTATTTAAEKKTRLQQQRKQQQQAQQQAQKARGASIVEMLSRQHQDLVIHSGTSPATATSTNSTNTAAQASAASVSGARARGGMGVSGVAGVGKPDYYEVVVAGHMHTTREVTSYMPLEKGAFVLFEGDRGVDMGRVVSCCHRDDHAAAAGDEAAGHGSGGAGRPRKGSHTHNTPLVLRAATAEEQDRWLNKQTAEAAEALGPCREAVAALRLPLTIVGAVYQFNREKLTFFYESDTRVDFRQLLQNLFSQFHCRIWMERVAPIDESANSTAAAMVK